MPSSNPSQTQNSPPQTDTQQPKPHQNSTQNDPVLDENQQKTELLVEEEEESECGFCLFMKAGGCRDQFIEWEKCVEEGEKNQEDIVDKCHSVTKALKDCMEANPDHYGPILLAEKAVEEEAVREVEKEMENVESVATIEVEEITSSSGSEQKVAS
ncbi:hypothetical protein Leryth_012475 [Lithospermum erythrorhizon]|nr:hypothetical protein Leryth_012475 [Lithospermum erythrorhizon]